MKKCKSLHQNLHKIINLYSVRIDSLQQDIFNKINVLNQREYNLILKKRIGKKLLI